MNLAELPDELDRAAAITQAEAEQGIAAARRACSGPSLSHCQECGEPIATDEYVFEIPQRLDVNPVAWAYETLKASGQLGETKDA